MLLLAFSGPRFCALAGMRGVLFAMAWTFAASTRLALVITNRHSMARVEPRCQCLLRNILESPYGEMLETGRSGRFLGRTAEKLVTCEEQCQADVLKELCRVAKDCTKDVVVFRLEITLSAKESHQRISRAIPKSFSRAFSTKPKRCYLRASTLRPVPTPESECRNRCAL